MSDKLTPKDDTPLNQTAAKPQPVEENDGLHWPSAATGGAGAYRVSHPKTAEPGAAPDETAD